MLPKAILHKAGISGETSLLVDTSYDGAIVLRPTGVCPIEICNDERIAYRITPEQADKLYSALKK